MQILTQILKSFSEWTSTSNMEIKKQNAIKCSLTCFSTGKSIKKLFVFHRATKRLTDVAEDNFLFVTNAP